MFCQTVILQSISIFIAFQCNEVFYEIQYLYNKTIMHFDVPLGNIYREICKFSHPSNAYSTVHATPQSSIIKMIRFPLRALQQQPLRYRPLLNDDAAREPWLLASRERERCRYPLQTRVMHREGSGPCHKKHTLIHWIHLLCGTTRSCDNFAIDARFSPPIIIILPSSRARMGAKKGSPPVPMIIL